MRSAVFIAAICILPLPKFAAAADLSETVRKELTPEGYKIEKTIPCEPDHGAQQEHLVALSGVVDADHQFPANPVILLLVAARGKNIVIEDTVTLHDGSKTGKFWDGPPNIFSGLTRENVGGGDLFLVRSILSGGGSGSLHYFDFYRPENKKLRLVKSFSHGRTDQTYFAVYKNAVYDAECICTRGEKHGNAYVYTCHLQVTKFAFDGQEIQPVASERMREQRGNRYLEEKYWFVSVLKALQNNEVFAKSP